MSLHTKTEAIYRLDNSEEIGVDFLDDNGRSYTLQFHPSEPLIYLKARLEQQGKELSEREVSEAVDFQINPERYQNDTPNFVSRFINDSFDKWVENV